MTTKEFEVKQEIGQSVDQFFVFTGRPIIYWEPKIKNKKNSKSCEVLWRFFFVWWAKTEILENFLKFSNPGFKIFNDNFHVESWMECAPRKF